MEIAEKNASESKSQEQSKLKMLIVEDDFPSCKILEEYLSEYGDCTTAANGVEGVDAFKNALDAGTPYDLVCLDIMMPEMDGHEALRTIRKIEQEHGIFDPSGVSVIMTTAKDRSRDMIEAFDEGCASYIVKPIDQEKLGAEMQKLDLI
ncbi:MAG: response regulator transcription factor [Planctomycetota bacterium]|jgi:two-component system chemotaxis response regulator CheY